MADKEPRLISYTDVLQELEKSKPNNHLLLGNGFNLLDQYAIRYANYTASVVPLESLWQWFPC